MGANLVYLDKPDLKKYTKTGVGKGYTYAVCSMRGWRLNMEDAHICNPSFDQNSGLFGVFDGHGGCEVA